MGCRPTRVSDSNVWIDLANGGLLEAAFRLPWDWLTPDVVVAEVLERDDRLLSAHYLEQLGLQVCELPGDLVATVANLAAHYRRPSRPDLFALVLARDRGVVLVTGDRHLRTAAETEGIEVHGTLWVLDELIRYRLISPAEAAAALRRMIVHGGRFPPQEVTNRLRRWACRRT